ncbi:S-adenosyl-L-methionine-dependent methyltransferase [Tribonema minus]|uniref:S-adenosyl-L-methionine-dependent methyltransferase n=1 Tax=Tribonema minus TaxID=303371 RepID=A0A835Z6D8_9STRA|nr:S-adenosyl-L-methionine-dependent methyltransferase [Tribonema minus]
MDESKESGEGSVMPMDASEEGKDASGDSTESEPELAAAAATVEAEPGAKRAVPEADTGAPDEPASKRAKVGTNGDAADQAAAASAASASAAPASGAAASASGAAADTSAGGEAAGAQGEDSSAADAGGAAGGAAPVEEFTGRPKLLLGELPRFWDQRGLAKWLVQAGITTHHKAIKIPNTGSATLTFDTKEDRAAAKDIVEVTTPWFKHKTYPQQLLDKEKELSKQCYNKILAGLHDVYAQRIKQAKRDNNLNDSAIGTPADFVKPRWLAENKRGSVPWSVTLIKESPNTGAYRHVWNKCEFTIGAGADGLPAVGFRLSSFKGGSVVVAGAEACPNVPSQMKLACAALQRHIRTSALPVYDVLQHKGVWRCASLRRGERTGEMAICITVCLKEDDHKVNTTGAEVLYQTIVEDAELGPDSTVLDVCCGTGSIGLCCAKASGCKVVGVELCPSAVDDAKSNATLNAIPAHFVCDRAEAVLAGMLQSITAGRYGEHTPESRVVAVVDPPREGLHQACARALRSAAFVKRVVYVSCNPTKSLPRDALVLCSPASRKLSGEPFRPVKATPVDMFPHTPHCEMVMVFERD